MPAPSSHFSYAELEGLWISQGGPARLAPLMAAIAMAESGGSAQARNPSGASGLWQILGNPFPGDPFNPQVNARMAVAKWKSQGLGAWASYTSGAYKRFLRRGVPPAGPGGGTSAPVGIPYRNPLRGVRGLTAERIDMGVDYGGTGPIYALGPGVITSTMNPGWGPPAGVAPGAFIGERLTAGPLKGHYVYAAEGIRPSVRVGQRVTSGTQIGTLTGGGIETGFAAAPGTGAALGASQFSGSNATAYGVAYSKLLSELGAPAGVGPKTGGTGSTSGGWPPPWLVGILSGIDIGTGGTGQAGTGVAGSLGGIGQALGGIVTWLNGLSTAVDWLLNPANWVRILAGVGGGLMTISGVFVLSHVGGQVPVPGVGGSVSARPAALPVGILLVGGGGVLLFVAFHNLPGSPANVGELLGSLRDEAQAASAPAGVKAAA